jgi:DNA-binding MarR family transcriptional regulator
MIDDEAVNAGMRHWFPPTEMRILVKAIRRIVRANDLHSKALARATGLTAPQLAVLTGVAELGEVTTNALSDYADLSPATVVTILDNLEQRGIVDRYRSTLDRRIVFTRLTERGRAMISSTPGFFGADFAARFAALPPDKRASMLSAVSELADLLARDPPRSTPAQGTPGSRPAA